MESDTDGGGRLRITFEDAVAHVAMARADKANAMDGAMFAALGDTFARLGGDARVRAILLSGEGRHFSAGIDLRDAAAMLAGGADEGRAAERRLRHIERLQAAVSAVEAARVPVVAAIHGGCIGAGVDLASACDLRVAARDGWFAVAEVDHAITADLGTLQRLGHLLPHGLVRELAFTGRRMDAEEAARHGFVNRLAPDRDSAIAAALDLARLIAAKAPLAVAGTKRSLNHSRGRPVEEGLAQVALWNAAALAGPDIGEAMRARMANEEPRFAPLSGEMD